MSNNERCLEIGKELTNCRSKIGALYNLINVTLLDAEQDRTELSSNYEKMIDYKDNVNTILTDVSAVKKSERPQVITKNKSALKKIHKEANEVNQSFVALLAKYKKVLKESLPLKTEYIEEAKKLSAEIKVLVSNGELDDVFKKGFSQQIKMINAYKENIEKLVSDYNVKRNQLDKDNEKFNALYTSVNDAISSLQVSA